MPWKAFLVLEDGSYYPGEGFGAQTFSSGEVVFSTSMTGYQEMLTDPSYAGQILVATYPLIGNYGISPQEVESRRIQVSGLVVREHSPTPSHRQSVMTLHEYLASQGVPGISGVDTRALTRRLRTCGTMMGAITPGSPEEALSQLARTRRYGEVDWVARVSTPEAYVWDQAAPGAGWTIIILDYGLKYNIARILQKKGCSVVTLPHTTPAAEVLARRPSGVVLSPGPGDPAVMGYSLETIRGLIGRVPILGICLGHQLIARAFGGKTFKLKFGHRGANHPVKDLTTGRVYITTQNHGYAVDAESLPPALEVSQVSLNDYTVEGLRHRELPLFSIQYHPEASPGPRDNEYIFDRFLSMVGASCKSEEDRGQGPGGATS